MKSIVLKTGILSILFTLLVAAPLLAQTVKITPLGSHDGEFCSNDRAMLFEDPDGTRLLYDPGRTVAGAGDARLGDVHAVLLSGVHADHIGDRHIERVGSGTCLQPQANVATIPHSNTAMIIAAKQAKAFLGGEMHWFLKEKVRDAGGSPDQIEVLRFGGERQIGGVRIAIVPVTHSNGIDPAFIKDELAGLLKYDGLTAYAGPDNGYILTFSNGLVVYLSGDSGISADQEVTVRGFYGAELAIINAGGIFTSGPREAAYSINILVKPKAVIPHHMNEAATERGLVRPGSKTAQFIGLIDSIPVHVPLSGITMQFDGDARCVSGCR